MKKNISAILKSGMLLGALLGIVSIVHAQTWSAPTGTPPSSNVAAPINVGSNSQFRLGALGLGEASSTTVANTATGFTLEVNGPTSTNGLASFGASYITSFTHIGPLPTSTGTTCYSDGQNYQAAPGTYSSVDLVKPLNLASNSNKSFFSTLMDKVALATEDLFHPITAYALGYVDSSGTMTPPGTYHPDPYYGPCYGQTCSSEQYCDAATKSCQNNSGGSGTSNPPTAAYPSGHIAMLNLSFTAGPSVSGATNTTYTASSGTVYFKWYASGASGCSISSSNIVSNWNNSSLTLNSSGYGYGTNSLSLTTPGTYTYTLQCSPASGAVAFEGGTSAMVTVNIGQNYVFQVNGNSSLEGYVIADGTVTSNGGFIERGRRVCLQDGTDCQPLPTTITNVVTTDQGGALELGANHASGTAVSPYIDFHGQSTGTTADYNVRIINDRNGGLSFYNSSGQILYIDSSGNIYSHGVFHASYF